MFLNKINFVAKICLALLILAFSAWYQHAIYNLGAIFVFMILLRLEKVTLFRFNRQGYFFSFFLLLLFVFRSFSGYGKILLQLPGGLQVTDGGLHTALTFVSQILLIFILFSLVISSTPEQEIRFYFRRLHASQRKRVFFFQRLARIVLYVIYLIPLTMGVQKQISRQVQHQIKHNTDDISLKIKTILNHIYDFIIRILMVSVDEYASFLSRQFNEPVQSIGLFNTPTLITALLIIGGHAVFIAFR